MPEPRNGLNKSASGLGIGEEKPLDRWHLKLSLDTESGLSSHRLEIETSHSFQFTWDTVSELVEITRCPCHRLDYWNHWMNCGRVSPVGSYGIPTSRLTSDN